MNQTTFPASSLDPDTATKFSRANLFGMFLTLQLCQLTQPYGSLLFRGSSGFLWRVNPIASFTEALTIVTYLLKAVWGAWREGQGFGGTPWAKKLRATASALLLLRGALDDEDGGLMAKLMVASSLDGARNAETLSANEGTTPPSRMGARDEAAGAQLEHSRMQDTAERYGMGHRGMQSNIQNSQTATPQQGVLRRRTSQLESATPRRTNTITGPDLSNERSQLLRAAFGSNALAHRELRIHSVTAVSVLVIFVKLLAISSSWIILMAAHFMVYGWLLLQSLLLIFHSGKMSDLDMASSVRAARLVDAELKESSSRWWSLYTGLHAPLLGYLCYSLTFRLVLPHWVSTILFVCRISISMVALTFILPLCFISCIVNIASYIVNMVGASWTQIRLEANEITLRKLVTGFPVVVLGGPLILWIELGTLTYILKECAEVSPVTDAYTALFKNSTMNFIVDSGFTRSVHGLWAVILFLVSMIVFWHVLLPTAIRAEATYRVSLRTFVVTISVFIYYLVTNDLQGSNKPAWTEWLG
ncbi:hypothetical protein F5882DRAFT_421692 [Hyaloscypha sp. PMI_1271]|nr:hypothetical protein F5882DRAFT_421692 [Hyaloscypha sp. PMI_1271]